MDLPIRFPSDADVAYEEAARFRALSPAEQVRSICDMYETGMWLVRQSPKADFMRRYADEHEERGRDAVREFITRYAA